MAGQPPPGEPVPADGGLPAESERGLGSGAVRRLRARSLLPDPVRLLRFQHLHRGRARFRGVQGDLRRARDRGDPAGRPGTRGPGRPGADGVLRRRHADPAAARRPGGHPAAPSTAELGLAAGAEITTEANPESVDERGAGAAAGQRLHPRLARHAERGAARARRAGPGAPARAAGGLRRLGQGGRVRAGQPRPHLRHAGRDATPTGSCPCAARSRPARTTSLRMH